MEFSTLSRFAGAAALGLTLTACMDVSMSVEVLSETEAEARMVTTMGADIYQMLSAQAVEGEDEFCAEGELIEAGEFVECAMVRTGPFDDLAFDDEDESSATLVAIGNGQVRVSFPTGDLADSIAQEALTEEDAQMQAMIAAMFEGHFITMAVSGGAIVETNMDVAVDGLSATYRIAFSDLLGNTLALPPEIYAVVQK